MSNPDIEEILTQTLADGRLSRSERKALRSLADSVDADRRAYWRSRAFALAKARDPARAAETLEWVEDVVKALIPTPSAQGAGEAYFSPGEACRRRLVSLLRNAQHTADICVFTITDDDVSREVHAAHARGVRVRVITDNDKAWDKGSDADRLRDKGVPLRVDVTEAHMHHKFAIFDGRLLANGSYNWTRSAFKYNEENIMVVEDAGLIRAFQAEFDTLWARFA